MNAEKHKKFIESLHNEYQKFKDDYAYNKTTYDVFDDIRKVYIYDQIYDFLLCNACDFNIKFLQTINILDHYYREFNRTNYDIINEDLREFFKDQMEIEKKKLNESEM